MLARRLIQLVPLAVLALAAPVAAGEWIYWVREGEIGRLAVDGSQSETMLGGSSTITSIAYDAEGLGRILGDSSTVETLSDLPRVEAIFVTSEPDR